MKTNLETTEQKRAAIEATSRSAKELFRLAIEVFSENGAFEDFHANQKAMRILKVIKDDIDYIIFELNEDNDMILELGDM